MVKMQARGGVVSFADFSPDAVKEVLSEVGLNPREDSPTWTQAFGEFSLLLTPQTRGTYLLDSMEGDAPSPTEFFAALAPYLVDGSWLAFKEVGVTTVKVLMLQGGVESLKELSPHDVFQGEEAGNMTAEQFSAYVFETLSTLGYELLPV